MLCVCVGERERERERERVGEGKGLNLHSEVVVHAVCTSQPVDKSELKVMHALILPPSTHTGTHTIHIHVHIHVQMYLIWQVKKMVV